MNGKVVLFTVMLCIIAALLVGNFFFLGDRGAETVLDVDTETKNVLSMEIETAAGEIQNEVSSTKQDKQETSPFYVEIPEGEAASSVAAELESDGGGERATFGSIYEEYYDDDYSTQKGVDLER